MTETPTYEQLFHADLDASPGDLVTRSVYADWLEDQGRADEAAGQRWLARAGKWPTHELVYNNEARYVKEAPWDWWGEPGGTIESLGLPHSRLPQEFWDGAKNCGRYATRAAAEAAAVAWARSAGLLGG